MTALILFGDVKCPTVDTSTHQLRLDIEQKAYDALSTDPGGTSPEDNWPESVAEVIFPMTQDWRMRDPWVVRVIENDLTSEAMLALIVALTTYEPDAMLSSTAALLAWITGQREVAGALASAAEEMHDPRATLAAVVADAVKYGLPSDTWEALTLDLPMEVLRGLSAAEVLEDPPVEILVDL